MNIPILYEDENILAVNKPAGISVHSDGKTKEETVADFILTQYPELVSVGEPMKIEYKGESILLPRPGIVHRLDKETSGVLLVAKNQQTFDLLKEQFHNHTIQKIYHAFTYGWIPDPKASLAMGKRGIISAPIGRSPIDIRAWTAGRGAREPIREAVTEYSILQHFTDTDEEKPPQEHRFTYVELYPKTGRTHQIRVHLRYINFPIVSDPLYSGTKEKALGMDRLALHASKITFRLSNGDIKTVEAPFPVDFEKVLKTYIK